MPFIFALSMGFVANAAFDPARIEHERLFQLDFRGHRSYLFAIDNEPRHDGLFELVAARASLNQICEVVLRGQPDANQRHTARAETIVLAEILSPAAKKVMKKLDLEGLLDRKRKITPGDAWRAIRQNWQVHLDAAAVRYLASLPAADALVLSDETEFDENLHLAAPILWRKRHHAFTDHTLMKRAIEWQAEAFERAQSAPVVRFEEELVATASLNRKDITALEAYATPPETPDLEALLDYLGARLKASDEEIYLGHLVAQTMSQKLAEDYFRMSPTAYFTLRETLAESGLTSHSYFPGEESLRRYDANVHESWAGRILSALAKHPTFVSLDAKYVLPMTDSERTRSVLEILQDRGVEITPVVPHRGLRAVP